MKINISENLQKLAKIFGRKTNLYVVGGFVRDQILGLETTDIDICSSLTVTRVQKMLENSKFCIKDVNKRLGSAKICIEDEVYDYCCFRSETYPDDGSHTPVDVEFVKDIKLDAKRRDFTMNCVYYDITNQKIIDFYNGVKDIKRKKIRCVENPFTVFQNDGLRILRMIRQAGQLNFSVAKDTLACAKRMTFMLQDISATRKTDELMLLLESKYKRNKKSFLKGLKLFNRLGIWKYYFENLEYVKYNIVKKVDIQNRFAGLLIDIINSLNPDCVSYFLENSLGQNGLGLSKQKVSKDIEIVCGYFDAYNLLNNKDYFFKYYNSFPQIAKILEKGSGYLYRKYNFFYKYINKYKVPIQIKDLKINGNDIKANFPKIEEKRYKFILTDLLNKVFRAQVDNNKQCLLAEVKKYED